MVRYNEEGTCRNKTKMKTKANASSKTIEGANVGIERRRNVEIDSYLLVGAKLVFVTLYSIWIAFDGVR